MFGLRSNHLTTNPVVNVVGLKTHTCQLLKQISFFVRQPAPTDHADGLTALVGNDVLRLVSDFFESRSPIDSYELATFANVRLFDSVFTVYILVIEPTTVAQPTIIGCRIFTRDNTQKLTKAIV